MVMNEDDEHLWTFRTISVSSIFTRTISFRITLPLSRTVSDAISSELAFLTKQKIKD